MNLTHVRCRYLWYATNNPCAHHARYYRMQEVFLHATNRSERPVAAISLVSPLGSPGRTEGITTEPKYRSAPVEEIRTV